MFATMVLFMVCGMWFDFIGPKASAVGGSLMSCLSIFGIGVTIALNAKTWPWTQWALMYLFCILADMGGFAASMGIMAWLWHYPRRQTFLIGLSNGCVSSATAMGMLVPMLVDAGFCASTSFMILSSSGALAAVGLYLATPSQAEFYRHAAKVLNMQVAGIAAQKPSWWSLKLGLKSLWAILRVFPTLNLLVYLAVGFGSVGYMRWMSNWGDKYRLWFDDNEVEHLSMLFATVVPIFSIVLNPLSGILMDVVGLGRYTIIIIVATAGMAVAEPLPIFRAQQAFMWLFALYMGTIQNIPGRWPLYFVPPHLFGLSFGSMNAVGGIFGFALNPLLDSLGLTGDGPTCVMLATCSFGLGIAGSSLLVSGLPKRPPRNRFDTAAYCMNAEPTQNYGSVC